LAPWIAIVSTPGWSAGREADGCVCAGNGSLTEAELRTALVNGDWSPFDPHTVRMMIRYGMRG
jgi:hypothetical protein